MVGLVLFCSVCMVLAAQISSAQQYFIIAPNVIRVDVDESILINLKGVPQDEVITVTLYFRMSGSNTRLAETTVDVAGDPDSLHRATMRIDRSELPVLQSTGHEFITLVVQSDSPILSFQDSKPILLSMKSGFVFIQTDKPLYTPSQTVDIRIVVLNQKMFPDLNMVRVEIMSPNKIVVHQKMKKATAGFAVVQFHFPPVPVFGKWTVTVFYGHLFKAKTSVEFEVKEYVLPKFQVAVQTSKEYVLPETEFLRTTVTATYVFGERVFGKFLLKYGVFTDDDNLLILQETENTLGNGGIGYADFRVSDIPADQMETLMGKSLIIQAFVTDVANGETINTNHTRVVFTRTPYRFNWDNTRRYFKKGLPFPVKAIVQYVNGLPASNVPVTIRRMDGGNQDFSDDDQNGDTRNSGPNGEIYFRLDMPNDAAEVELHLETADGELNEESNAESSFTLRSENSPVSEFLLIRIPMGGFEQTQQIDSASSTEVLLSQPKNVALHFFVISGGKIEYETKRQIQNANTAFQFTITPKMAPVSRVVAYYINEDGQVIADALLMRVQEKCENPVTVGFVGLPREEGSNIYKSDFKEKQITVKVTAKPDTNVGLLAVDEAVFALLKYHRLTQKKVFERMAGYDLGCGPGGGQTAADIFKDAGVTVMTTATLSVPHREEIECPQAIQRAKRSMSDEETSQILDNYEGDRRTYCAMGLREVTDPQSFPCIRRAKMLARREGLRLDSPLVEAFYDCCKSKATANQGRSDGDEALDLAVNEQDAMIRSDFPESWMFFNLETGEDGSKLRSVTLRDSVTTWVVEAVGVSNQYLMCVAEPAKLRVRPLFFLDLALPYSVKRLEQIEIIVTVFNYAEEELPVSVRLKGADGLCSEAQPGELSEAKTINVLPNEPGAVKFVIIPLEAKRIPIEVHAFSNLKGKDNHNDAVKKYLNVYQEGLIQRFTEPITVDPVNSRSLAPNINGGPAQSFQHDQFWGEEGENSQIDVIRYNLNKDAIPGTHKVFISLMGSIMGNVIETVLGGLDSLLEIPRGCGEQTMLFLAPNVYVYRYLKHSDQYTADLEESAKQYIENGVTRELTFRQVDGSFAAWPNRPGSTWLTTFVTKVFCQAREFAFIDDDVTCKALEWLTTTTQNEDGSFREGSIVHHKEMIGSVQGSVSMTAFVLISLLECECATVDTSNSVALASAFLEGQLQQLTRPYAIAITAYALALANSDLADEALTMLKDIATYEEESKHRYWALDVLSYGAGPKPYWYTRKPEAIEVETTSYALLAFLQLDDVSYSHDIVKWLTNQENYQGGFVSTQDTVIALQALSAYSIKSDTNVIDIGCQVSCQEAEFDQEFLLKPDNAILRQFAEIRVPEHQSEFKVSFDSAGTGMGQLKFESSYNIPEPNVDNCDFVLNINQEAIEVDENNQRIQYTIELSYLKGETTGMAILEVGLYTGYQAMAEDLDEVKQNSGDNIHLIEETDLSVVFYLDEISRDRVEEITFKAERKLKVGKLQPVLVKVFDYYNPTVECSKFIHPDEGGAQLSTLCVGNTCSCAAGKCAPGIIIDHRTIGVAELKLKACDTAAHFAFEAEVVSTKRRGSFQSISMTILTPVKPGLDLVAMNQNRTFLKSMSCDEPDLKPRRYLVIGTGGIPFKDDMGQPSYKYLIDEKMSFYEWPKEGGGRDLTKNRWKNLKRKLDQLKQQLISGTGCPT
ncbi:complement C3-like isoform X1 [Asterias amurensis]|uniref:complement C3-like isoform X1 n=1 Tax=Asterias amurensis TaxID=7602 RepID=UPI003AB68D19